MTTVVLSPKLAKPAIKLTPKAFDELIRNSNMRIIFSPISFGDEKMAVYRKPDFNTACWSFLPPHNIMIGEGIFDRYVKKPKHGEDALELYLHAYNSHEHAHAKWTERDLEKVNDELKALKLVFALFNLFEDARIEHLWRLEVGEPFNWLEFEANALDQIPEADGPAQAGAWFFCFIQSEEKLTPADKRVAKSTVAARVYSYYERAIMARDSWALFPLMLEWMREFPPPPPQSGSGKPGSGTPSAGDPRDGLELGMALAADPKAMADFLKDAKLVGDSPKPSETEGAGEKHKKDVESVPDNTKSIMGNEANFLAPHPKKLDFTRADACATKLAKGFLVRKGLVPTAEPQKKISSLAYILGNASFYRRKSIKRPGRKKGVLFMDCSGSMSQAIDEGILIAATLSRLARRGLFEGYLILTVGSPAKHLVYKFPLGDDKLARLYGFGGSECIEPGILATKHLWKGLDFAAFYTDADIGDTPIDKAALHALGIYTYGLYAGNGEGPESRTVGKMLKFFDKAIVRKNAEELTDALMLQLKATRWT